MRQLWLQLLNRLSEDGHVALVTLADAEGSTPREAGARMIVTSAGDILGTIGGGTLEYRLIAEAQAALHDQNWVTQLRDIPLGPELGQCCGGRLTYLIETFALADLVHVRDFSSREAQGDFSSEGRVGKAAHLQRRADGAVLTSEPISADDDLVREVFVDQRTPVLLFGAGHVGRALTLALAPLPFRVRWIDSRDDAFPQLMPQNVTAVIAADIEAEIRLAPWNAAVLVMTHSHPLDLAIVSAALKRADLSFVGLIGSETKQARFMRRLNDSGLGEAARERLVSPIGLPQISGKEPAVIAASIVADLLIRREMALQRRRDVNIMMPTFSPLDLEDHPHER